MNKTIVLSAAALLALSAPAFAGAHNQAADNDSRSATATENLGKVPSGLLNDTPGKGLSNATKKPGKGKKAD